MYDNYNHDVQISKIRIKTLMVLYLIVPNFKWTAYFLYLLKAFPLIVFLNGFSFFICFIHCTYTTSIYLPVHLCTFIFFIFFLSISWHSWLFFHIEKRMEEEIIKLTSMDRHTEVEYNLSAHRLHYRPVVWHIRAINKCVDCVDNSDILWVLHQLWVSAKKQREKKKN